MSKPVIKVVIPARNEVQAITKVIKAIPVHIDEIIVSRPAQQPFLFKRPVMAAPVLQV